MIEKVAWANKLEWNFLCNGMSRHEFPLDAKTMMRIFFYLSHMNKLKQHSPKISKSNEEIRDKMKQRCLMISNYERNREKK